MNSAFRKLVAGGAGAIVIAAASAASVTPAAAQHWHGGYGYHGGYGVPLAAGILGGLAVGAIAGAPYYGYGYNYGPAYPVGCYYVRQPAYDGYGYFVGYRPVQVCR